MKLQELSKLFVIAIFSTVLIACGSSDNEGPDTDNDGVPNSRDNCIQTPNADQLNTDSDSAGDACDDAPSNASITKDNDRDGIDDSIDPNDDLDDYNDDVDAFPLDSTEWADKDNDGIGDNKDLDPNNANPNSIQLDQLIKNKRVTKFVGVNMGFNTDDGRVGKVVKNIGDVNGDQFDDLFIGVGDTILGYATTGQGYILFGNDNGWPETVDLANLSAIPHVLFQGDVLSDLEARLGEEVVPLGDIDGDNISDFLIGAPSLGNIEGENYNGSVYLVFGRDDWSSVAGDDNIITIADLSTLAIEFKGRSKSGRLGKIMKAVGDINNDGKQDIALAEFPSIDAGRVHLMFNLHSYTKSNIGDVYNIEDITNTESSFNRVTLQANYTNFGERVDAIGDFNDDGFDDILVSDNKDAYIALYIIYGKSNAAWDDLVKVPELAASERIRIQYDRSDPVYEYNSDYPELAQDVAIADINQDTIPDILITAPASINEPSELHVLFGGKNWPAEVDVFTLPEDLTQTVKSELINNQMGIQLEMVPDLNGNGRPEVLIASGNFRDEIGDNIWGIDQVYKFDSSEINSNLIIGPQLVEDGVAELLTLNDTDKRHNFYINTVGDVNADGLSEMTFSSMIKGAEGVPRVGEFYLLYGYDQLYPQAFEAGEAQQ